MRTSSSPARASPGMLQVGQVRARLAARDHPGIVRVAGQGGQQPRGRWRRRHRSPADFAVGKSQFAGVEINVLPVQLASGLGVAGRIVAHQVVTDAVGDARSGGLDGVPRQVGVARRGLGLGVAQELPDHGEALAERQSA